MSSPAIPEHDGFVSAIGRLETATTTLMGEVDRLRDFKEGIIALCPVHAKRIENVENGIIQIKAILETGEQWMKDRDLERAAFSGAWKFAILLSSALSGGVAFYVALKGIL